MKGFKKCCALILSAAIMISLTCCGKEGKIDKRERTIRDSVLVTVERDPDKTTGDTSTATVTTEDLTGTDTPTGTTEVVTTETQTNVDPDAEKAFKQFEDDFFKETLENSFLNYYYTVIDGSKYGVKKPEPTFGEPEWSDEVIEADRKDAEEWLNRLKEIKRDGLNETDQITYDLLVEDFEDSLKVYDYIFYTGSFSPNNGFQERFSNYFTDYEFRNKENIDDYIALLESAPDYIDKLIEFEKYRATKGYVMSDNNIDEVIEQCNTFTKDGENQFLISIFNNSIDELDFLTDEEKKAYKEKDKDVILNKVLPAFDKIAAEIATLKGTGTNQGGLAGYDGGKECYAIIMKSHTGSSKTPEEALELLYNRLDSFMSEMVALYQEDPSAYEYFTNHYGDGKYGADSMTPQEIIDKLMVVDTAEYPDIGKIPYTVSYFDKTLEPIMDRTLAYYRSPGLDDPDNNIIRVNGGLNEGLWATLAHEGYPGHMYQRAYYMSTNPSNLRSIIGFLGYGEGWAEYVGYHSYSLWDYPDTESDETVGKFFALDSEINLLIWGIMDIEVNYNGWTIEDAKKWFRENGYNEDAAQIMFDVVVGDPGLYQSYVLGYYEMKGLREKAEKELGSKFNPVEFHRVILETGPVQFDILEKQVDKYIQETK